jgi:uncharacterized phosphosugar-binding protein
MSVSAQAYAVAVRDLIERVARDNAAQVTTAAALMVEALRSGGVVQTFGTGHSEALAMELSGRAGGLVPTNKLALRDLVVYGGAAPEILHDEKLERESGIAQRVYDLASPSPQDIFVVASQSGINHSIVEFALLVTERGHRLIAITSAAHTARATPRHPSGKRLAEIADVVLDNGAPYGDALLPLPGGGTVGAVSSITAALLGQSMIIEAVRQLQAAGEVPPIYLSANVPGGDEHNQSLESRYAGRIRRGA